MPEKTKPFSLKKKKAKIGQIETEQWEMAEIAKHAHHMVELIPWTKENLICLWCWECASPLIDFAEKEAKDGK
jgi:hypothetical protein